MVVAGACTYISTETYRINLPRIAMRNGETHLFDNSLPCTDGVPIVELVLSEVELGYFRSVLNLIDRSLNLGLADGHHEKSK